VLLSFVSLLRKHSIVSMKLFQVFRVLFVSLILHCFVSIHTQGILTNSATYLNSRIWLFNNTYIIGSISSATVDAVTQTAILGTTNALILMNLAGSFLNNSNFLFKVFQQDVMSEFVGPQIDPSTRFVLVAGHAAPSTIGLFYLDSLNLVDVGFAVGNLNPIQAPALQDIFGSVKDSQYAYFASRTLPGYIGRISFQNFTNGLELFPTNLSLSSIANDASRGVIYCGLADSRVLRLTINDSNFAASTMTIIPTSANDSLIQIQVDPIRNLIYAMTQGSYNNKQAVIVRIDGNSFTETGLLVLSPLDYSISSSAIVDTQAGGLLYLGTSQVPGRLIQISLPDFTEETAFFTNGLGQFTSAFLDNNRTLLYFGSLDIPTQSAALYQFQAADPCLDFCFGHGVCTYRTCSCGTAVLNNVTLPWLLPWCEFLDCQFPNCSGNGVCINGTCNCKSIWTGVACQIRQCPNNCTSPDRGVCIYVNGVPIVCQCTTGWAGADCSIAQPIPCHLRTNCSDCISNPSCGWCESTQKCVDGDIIGPLDGTGCREYHSTECPNLGIPILNYIFTGFLGFMLLVNIITFIHYDASNERPGKRLEWYRFQRSEKAWSYIFQAQFIASVSLFGFAYPTFLVQFSVYWSWILLAFGMPWLAGPNVSSSQSSSRVLLEFDQYLTYAFNPAQLVLIQFLIWWGVATGAILIGVIVASLIAACCGREHVGSLLLNRLIYGILRSIDLGYFGLVIFSAIQLVEASVSLGFAILGALLLFVIGMFYPFLMQLIVLKVDRRTLFDDNFKDKLFPVYGLIKFQAIKWSFVPFAKRFFIAIAIGFFINYYPAQLAIIAAVLILYIVTLILVKPYADYLHAYLEFIVSVLTLVSLAFLFAFLALDVSWTTRLAMSIIFIILNYLALIACFTFYMISWFHMREVFSWRQLKKFIGRTKN